LKGNLCKHLVSQTSEHGKNIKRKQLVSQTQKNKQEYKKEAFVGC